MSSIHFPETLSRIFARDPKPVYDLSSYGSELRFYLHSDASTSQMTPALASAQYQTMLHPFGGVNRNPLLPHDIFMSAADTALVAHEGNDTAFNQDYTMHSHATGVIAHFAVCVGFMLNISAYTNGSPTLLGATFTLRTWRADGSPLDEWSTTSTPTTAFTVFAATGAQIFKCFEHISPGKRLRTEDNAPITLNITVNETVSGTNTRQVGVMPAFPLNGVGGAGVARMWCPSQVIMNIKPNIGNADFVGRD